MRSLDHARETCESYLPGLLDKIARVPLAEREAPGSPVIGLFRAGRGPALVIPTEYGGLGAGPLDAMRVLRAIGAASPSLAVASTMHHFSVATLFTLADSLKSSGLEWALLEAVAKENLLVASGFAEGRTGQGILSPSMTAVPAEGGYLVNGAKKPCSLATSMDLLTAALTVPGKDGEPELAFLLIPATQPGVSVHPFWSSRVLAGAESDEVRLEDVHVEEQLVMRTEAREGDGLDELQTLGFLWFELLISAGYLGAASTLAERAMTEKRGSASDRSAIGCRLETATLLLEGVARRIDEQASSNDALAEVLIARYAAQDAINDAAAKAIELLGGMAFIGGDEVAYYAGAYHCLGFHPPSRSKTEASLLDYLEGSGPVLVG
ncbi:acyl-CoA dehydrogenase family protein [Yinghuangia seranimata]|uniref:acyl-CoA dehydrogenase family protein n=1 Tax=Yinghuangia seranimata TaxID=408067 RepID=UPI00248BFEFB|nr:acyl-CoA dehydrogenase family protein [Yinghuangia seranimata]MDI2130934.1 acyl-CoA dehydrogenase family protein [Yinghuangia seranimata]